MIEGGKNIHAKGGAQRRSRRSAPFNFMRSALYTNGVVTEKYLWQGRTQLLAVFRASQA